MARRRSSGGRVLDMKQWSDVPRSTASIATATTTLGAGVLAFAEPATILRCRGFFQASLNASQQVGDTIALTIGLGIVSTDAATVGAGSMPDPGGEPEYPWLWWGSMFLRSYLAVGVNAWGISAQRLEIDTKAMRRVKPGQSLVVVVESAGVTGAPTTDLDFGQIRVLVGT